VSSLINRAWGPTPTRFARFARRPLGLPRRLRRPRAVTISLALIIALAHLGHAQPTFTPYADARRVLTSLGDILPQELKTVDQQSTWSAWIAGHDREIRRRLARGDDDTVVNWLFFGTTFTSRARVKLAPGVPPDQDVMSLVSARARDLASALSAPGTDERRLVARSLLERKGLRFGTATDRARVEDYLVTEVARVFGEWRQYARDLETARSLGNASDDFAARSKLFRDRGLSLDTTIQPSFALERALHEMSARGLIKSRSLRRVAVVGPGLDFSDKGAGYDFYPQQTLQPFALVDTLRRLDLLDAAVVPAAAIVTTLDISPRVNDHLRRARTAATNGRPYTLHLPLDSTVHWTPELLDYWRRAGGEIGAEIREPIPSSFEGQVQVRAVRVRAQIVREVSPEDLNIVTQRLGGAPFDLVVATNVFVYYDTLDQSLALANVASMLAPGGFLLSNNALLELPDSPVRSAGYVTVPYSDRADDGDHIVWYRR
jgi:hypothetical protein